MRRARVDGGDRTELVAGWERPARGDRSLTVALLGPMTVSVAGRPLPLTSDRLRSLLAVLALSAGKTVSIGRLATAVWGDHQPADVLATVQLYVSRLRKALGPTVIHSAPRGYLLNTEPENVDAVHFERLLDAATCSIDHTTQRSSLVEALALWRGTPFADLKSTWLTEVEATRLVERYLAGTERLVDIDITDGRPNEVIAPLTELTAQYPLRERLWGHLMLALSHTGRQADALQAYQRLYRLLADGLGVEPGAAVQALHQQILTTAPAAASPASPVVRPSTLSVPRHLPADVTAFTGREHELADLDRILDTDTASVAIDGMAGVGKTALAVHAAHRFASRYPDGQLFVDLHGHTQNVAPVKPSDALHRMLRALGLPGGQIPRHLDERAALFRSRLAGRAALVVLDNAASEAQVAPLLPGTAGSLVLVTSRRRLSGLDQAHTLSLDSLPGDDAVILFARTVGAERVAGDAPELMSDVVDLCGRLPLAIRVAAARLRSRPSWTVAHLIHRLREQQHRLDELTAGQRSVGAALDLSYQQLDAGQQRAYRRLGLHPGPEIDAYAAAALIDTTPAQARRLLDQLLDIHMLHEAAPDRYQFHDLTRAHATYTAEMVDGDADRRAALARQLLYYGQTARTAMELLYPFESDLRPRLPSPSVPDPRQRHPENAGRWLDTEMPNLLAIARYAAAHDWPDHVQFLSATVHRHLRTRGQYTDAENLHDQALHAARATGSPTGQVMALTDLGHIHRRQGRHQEAADSFQQALVIARATGDRSGQLNALNGLGRIHRRRGRYEQAAETFEEALEVARVTGGHAGEAEALNGLGDTYWAQGRHERALTSFERSLDVARTTGNYVDQVDALNAIGHICRRQGRYTRAADNFDEALVIARRTGHRHAELSATVGLGDVHRMQGRHARAVESYEHVIAVAGQIGDRNWQFEAAQSLGRLQEAAGHPSRALAHHNQALELATELGQPDDQARAHDGLACAHHALDNHRHAEWHWRKALDILVALGTDHTDDEGANAPTIRAHLAALDRPDPQAARTVAS